MIKKIKIPIFLFHINCIIFLLSLFSLKVNAETKIVAKNGDTLFKISKQYRVPLKELMYKNNFNDATKIIEGEVKQTQTDEKPTPTFNQEDVDRIVKQRLEAEKSKHQRMLDEAKKQEQELAREKQIQEAKTSREKDLLK